MTASAPDVKLSRQAEAEVLREREMGSLLASAAEMLRM